MTDEADPHWIPDRATVLAYNDHVAQEFRANSGRVESFGYGDLLLLTTTGAKTGVRRMSPLVYLTVDGKILIIGSFRGSPKDPGWVHNLRTTPLAQVEVGAETYDVDAVELDGPERERAYTEIVKIAPIFGEYQGKIDRVIPIFELRRR
ncbi:nitroreductase family deazaflavin-dependent oxidoreductase [Mycobacterium sp. CBMA271]|uniref:nitroreductase/quinone reductase family protein n=1 Tax=unclassified Mycobacteroides TaxID=2618759 RepID=UPI0012DDB010|nr:MULTISPECIES: nitroreductase/quinone reductase family protein [unclassified Mycobacteroides]MUM18471.1 deazaflavin-dependent nitroreductase [Mycobacteroides sp. CBMA 326]MUM23740.1 nitroreductase family deazaflavin-dependent oxidoreductase [Mycobacteroides sp. CBMA 271]